MSEVIEKLVGMKRSEAVDEMIKMWWGSTKDRDELRAVLDFAFGEKKWSCDEFDRALRRLFLIALIEIEIKKGIMSGP